MRSVLRFVVGIAIFVAILLIIALVIIRPETDMPSKNILAEHSTWAGFALIANGIADCLAGNYQTGIANVLFGVVSVMKREGGNA